MYAAKILADSLAPEGDRLTTFEVTFPRFILAEMNTHRVLSRNSASSRAIPVKKAIKMVKEDPFVPESFIQNQAGMSGDLNLEGWRTIAAELTWQGAKWAALGAATILDRLELHKALANRILEPFKWHTAIISGTEWDNFFALRTDKNAQPEFRKIAQWMENLYLANTPRQLSYGSWHVPLVRTDELLSTGCPADLTGPVQIDWDFWKRVSVGRCARVSYLTHDGKRAPIMDVALHDRLMTNGHLSPFEHVARPRYTPRSSGNFKGFFQYRKEIPFEGNFKEAQEAQNALSSSKA